MASDNSSLYQKLTRVANDPNAAPMERAAANRRLRKLQPTDLTAQDILAVDDSAYGEREESFVKRTAPRRVGKWRVRV